MKYKNFRYGHQQKCQGGIENKPVENLNIPKLEQKTY